MGAVSPSIPAASSLLAMTLTASSTTLSKFGFSVKIPLKPAGPHNRLLLRQKSAVAIQISRYIKFCNSSLDLDRVVPGLESLQRDRCTDSEVAGHALEHPPEEDVFEVLRVADHRYAQSVDG